MNITAHVVDSNVNDAIMYKTGDEMYFYHTRANISTIRQRRLPTLQYLWTHPTQKSTALETENGQHDNMCAAISPTLPQNYAVIHSRWMKRNGCLNRLGNLAHGIRNKTGILIDRKAPCLLEPSYIDSILRSNNLLDAPVYVISDGLNPDIVHALEKHPVFGANVKTLPQIESWVGSDMMLGVLSSVFIGTPISTLSGNIARARMALGFDPKTNYIFPRKQQGDGSTWEFVCEDGDCLYDVRYLNHYVG